MPVRYILICQSFIFLYAGPIYSDTPIKYTGNGVERHFQQYLSYIVAVSFIGGGSRRLSIYKIRQLKVNTFFSTYDLTEVYRICLPILYHEKFKKNSLKSIS